MVRRAEPVADEALESVPLWEWIGDGKTVALLMALLCGLGGSSCSKGFHVEGSFKRIDGSAASGLSAVFSAVDQDLGQLPMARGRMIGACVAESPRDFCTRRQVSVVDGKGGYAFPIDDTQFYADEVAHLTYLVDVSLPTPTGAVSGPIARIATLPYIWQPKELLKLPETRLWEPTVPVVSRDQAGTKVHWNGPFPSGDGALGGIETIEMVFYEDGFPVWSFVRQPDESGQDEYSIPVDERFVEDGRLTMRVVADGPIPVYDAGGNTKPAGYRSRASAEVVYVGGGGSPLTRNKPCAVIEPTKRRELSPCPFTDGTLSTRAQKTSLCDGQCPEGTAVEIDLGELKEVSMVVIRDAARNVNVHISADGVSWIPPTSDFLGGAQPLYFDGAPHMVSRIRVDLVGPPSSDGKYFLGEVSAW